MQPQLLKVDNIEESIKSVGLRFFTDRLLQDRLGDYYFLEVKEWHEDAAPDGWSDVEVLIQDGDEEKIVPVIYQPVRIPVNVAWFIIDAIKLQKQVMGIGSGEYDGPHGGEVTVLKHDEIMVEDL